MRLSSGRLQLLNNADEEAGKRSKTEEIVGDEEFEIDLYTCTVVAAMGGLEINLDEDKKQGAEMKLRIHPVFAWLLCIPLCCAQLLLLWLIDQDAEFQEPIWRTTDVRVQRLTKMVLIVIIQVMMFQEVHEALRILIFLLNPATWVDVIRADPVSGSLESDSEDSDSEEEQSFSDRVLGILWSGPCLLIPATLAISFKLVVVYLVTSESTTVILQCDKATENVFNALALTFIADLDIIFWRVFKGIFRLKTRSFGDQPDASRHRFYAQIPWPGAEDKTIWTRIYQTTTRHSRDQSSIGGHVWERWLCFSVLLMVYLRYTTTILWAWQHNVLPMALDTCSFLGWRSGQLRGFSEVSPLILPLHWLHYLVFQLVSVDISDQLIRTHNITLMEYCGNKTQNWQASPKRELDSFQVFSDLLCDPNYRGPFIGFCLLLLAVVLLPQVSWRLAKCWAKNVHEPLQHAVEEHGEQLHRTFTSYNSKLEKTMQEQIDSMRVEFEKKLEELTKKAS